MTTGQEYVESPIDWVRDQVRQIERNATTDGTTIEGRPVVLVTMRGARTGQLRKVPLMRVEHDGSYAVVASRGGAPRHPSWYHNLSAHPRVTLQDGEAVVEVVARELAGAERELWWERSVAAYPLYTDYQARTDRVIPVFLLEPATA